jgi:hypothetical protein
MALHPATAAKFSWLMGRIVARSGRLADSFRCQTGVVIASAETGYTEGREIWANRMVSGARRAVA